MSECDPPAPAQWIVHGQTFPSSHWLVSDALHILSTVL